MINTPLIDTMSSIMQSGRQPTSIIDSGFTERIRVLFKVILDMESKRNYSGFANVEMTDATEIEVTQACTELDHLLSTAEGAPTRMSYSDIRSFYTYMRSYSNGFKVTSEALRKNESHLREEGGNLMNAVHATFLNAGVQAMENSYLSNINVYPRSGVNLSEFFQTCFGVFNRSPENWDRVLSTAIQILGRAPGKIVMPPSLVPLATSGRLFHVNTNNVGTNNMASRSTPPSGNPTLSGLEIIPVPNTGMTREGTLVNHYFNGPRFSGSDRDLELEDYVKSGPFGIDPGKATVSTNYFGPCLLYTSPSPRDRG